MAYLTKTKHRWNPPQGWIHNPHEHIRFNVSGDATISDVDELLDRIHEMSQKYFMHKSTIFHDGVATIHCEVSVGIRDKLDDFVRLPEIRAFVGLIIYDDTYYVSHSASQTD